MFGKLVPLTSQRGFHTSAWSAGNPETRSGQIPKKDSTEKGAPQVKAEVHSNPTTAQTHQEIQQPYV